MSCQVCHSWHCKCDFGLPLYLQEKDKVRAEDVIIDDTDIDSKYTLMEFLTSLFSRLEKMERQIGEHQRDIYEIKGLKNIVERMINK